MIQNKFLWKSDRNSFTLSFSKERARMSWQSIMKLSNRTSKRGEVVHNVHVDHENSLRTIDNNHIRLHLGIITCNEFYIWCYSYANTLVNSYIYYQLQILWLGIMEKEVTHHHAKWKNVNMRNSKEYTLEMRIRLKSALRRNSPKDPTK